MMPEMTIVYEDGQICVVIKPQGIDSERGMCEALKSMLSRDVYAVHRLDKDAAGLMVYALTQKSAAALCTQMSCGGFKKEYLAVLLGRMADQSGTLEDMLYHDRAKNKSYVVKRPRKGVKSARLSYITLAEDVVQGRKTSLVGVRLYTGRTHQIRVQFSSRGCPLAGDVRYGGKISGVSLCLWSHKISFSHPLSGKQMSFVKLPSWDLPYDNECINRAFARLNDVQQ